jgi:hypothetical protein
MRWENSARISAPADLVWRLTMDITDWPSYVPTMRKVERLDGGPFRVGSTARISQPGQTPAVWTVTRLEPQHEFAWQTRRLGMTMTGSHVIEADGAGCRNTLAVEVAGPLSRLLGPLLGPMVRRSIDTENRAVKSRAEAEAGRLA